MSRFSVFFRRKRSKVSRWINKENKKVTVPKSEIKRMAKTSVELGIAQVVEAYDDGKLESREKKAIATSIAMYIFREMPWQKWARKIARWWSRQTIDVWTKDGMLKPHKK